MSLVKSSLKGKGTKKMSGEAILSLRGVKTNNNEIGNSIVQIKTDRPLTSGEITMLKTIFRDGIDYGKVVIHPHRYYGMNPKGTAMAPDGGVYFHPEDYLADFSATKVKPIDKVWFVHEMTHVWQFQKGFPVLKAGALLQGMKKTGIGDPYLYDITAKRNYGSGKYSHLPYCKFMEFNMESQAEILAHYYGVFINQNEGALGSGGDYKYLYEPNQGADRRKRLKSVAEAFILSDHSASWLPENPYVLMNVRRINH